MSAIDRDYEQGISDARWEIQYWWPDRCYRWVKSGRLSFGVRVPPVQDVDALLKPERLPVHDEQRARASRLAAQAQRNRSDGVVLACLRERGPLSAGEIAEAAELDKKTVYAVLMRRPDLFAHNGRAGRSRRWHVR